MSRTCVRLVVLTHQVSSIINRLDTGCQDLYHIVLILSWVNILRGKFGTTQRRTITWSQQDSSPQTQAQSRISHGLKSFSRQLCAGALSQERE